MREEDKESVGKGRGGGKEGGREYSHRTRGIRRVVEGGQLPFVILEEPGGQRVLGMLTGTRQPCAPLSVRRKWSLWWREWNKNLGRGSFLWT